MKRVLAVWILCLATSAASFGVLLVEDRTLGLPLPYTLPLAFAAMLIVGPLLQIGAARVWPQPRIVIRPAPEVTPAPAAASVAPAGAATTASPAAVPPRPRIAQGVVLFDLSRVAARRQAA
jgi:hypothetical protein